MDHSKFSVETNVELKVEEYFGCSFLVQKFNLLKVESSEF
jgi:hypothetical protein